ncbi:MAG: hypothetical protein J5792_02285 [Bacteroidales bacterium]|nr:hypothetical protein [Bacteroidales bacterium]
MNEELRITLCQSDIAWNSPDENMARYESYIRQAAGKSDLFLLPEMCLTGFVTDGTLTGEATGSPRLQTFASWARQHDMGIIAGVAVREKSLLYNRMHYFSPSGSTFHYDKRHLFRMGDENGYFSPGKKKTVFHCKGWKLFPQICYDLRFPEGCRNSYHNGTFLYDCLIVIANWPHSRQQVLRTLAQARAIENEAYLLLVNRTGTDNNGIRHSGGSMIIDFKGNIIKELPEGEEGSLSTTLSLSALNEFREKFPSHLDW